MSRFWRLIPLAALATAVALIAVGLVLAFYNEQAYRAQKTDEATVQARILASTVTAAVVFGDRLAAQEYVNALNANPEVEAVGIYDSGGALFASYGRSADKLPPATVHDDKPRFEGGRLIVTAPITQAGVRLGTVYLHMVTEPLARRLERYGGVGLLVTMASLLVAVLGAAQAALARAHNELTRHAAELDAANRALRAEIDEREKAQEALRRAQRIEAVGQLTAGIAHDFNNLLTAVLGNLDMLAARHGDDARSARMVQGAQRAAQRGAQLTAQLLAFSRRQRLAPEIVDLNRIVGNMEGMLRSTLGATMAIETKLAPGLPAALADPSQVELMILNLAINARDAMPAGGIISIETSTVRLGEPSRPEEPPAGDYVVVAVRDTGIGIAPDVIEHIFEPFFTTKDVGKGSGLGLPQVLGVAQQLGGGVRVHTLVGRGTTIGICLPRAASPASAEPDDAVGHSPSPAARPARLLLVDDDPDVRAVTAAMLRQAGHEVLEASSGAATLEVLAQEGGRVELLVADFAMPEMNGVTLAGAAREIVRDLPVLFVTGYADTAALSRFAAPEDVLQKPFGASELLARVAAALARARSAGGAAHRSA